MANILFRVDASEKVALGHLKRSLALSIALQRLGHAIYFLALDDLASKNILAQKNVFWTMGEVGSDEDVDNLILIANQIVADVLVVDSYSINSNYLTLLKNNKFKIVLFDDLFTQNFAVDALIHSLPVTLQVKHQVDLMMLGFEYVVLAPEYWDVNLRQPQERVQRILITFGGIDHYGLTEWAIEAINQLALEKFCSFTLDVVVGPYYSNLSKIEAVAKLSTLTVNLHIAPNSLRELFDSSDIVLTGGGGAVYESVRLGIPTIGVGLSEQQNKTIEVLDLADGIIGHHFTSSSDLSLLKKKLSYLIDAHEKRISLSEVGPNIIDGQGAKRIAQKITSALI